MRKKRSLAECRFIVHGGHFCRHAGQFAEQDIVTAQGQRHQCRTWLDHFQTELPRQVISETGRAHFGDARPAGCDYQRLRGGCQAAVCYAVCFAFTRNVADRRIEGEIHTAALSNRFIALLHEHFDNLPGRSVAE